MQELSDLLIKGDETVSLDVAALQLAELEFPGVQIGPFLEILDSHAIELSERLGEGGGREFVEAANHYLFEELGFRGNQEDYYAPWNSCLNEVLTQRTGIPITLSIVYMEIARRLAKPVHGIGLPGHFLIRYDDGDYAAFIDPFHGGRTLTEPDCFELAREVTGVEIAAESHYLKPVGKRQILLRMLNNLRSAYFREKRFDKGVEVLNILIEAMPASAEEYKQRGILQVQLGRFEAAATDLARYLELAPRASDREQVERQIEAIHNWRAALN